MVNIVWRVGCIPLNRFPNALISEFRLSITLVATMDLPYVTGLAAKVRDTIRVTQEAIGFV